MPGNKTLQSSHKEKSRACVLREFTLQPNFELQENAFQIFNIFNVNISLRTKFFQISESRCDGTNQYKIIFLLHSSYYFV